MLNEEGNNCIYTSLEFTKTLGLNLNKRDFTKKLLIHPHFPSLISISEVFNHYNLANLSVKLDLSQLVTIKEPIMVFLNIKGGIFAIVNKITSKFIIWSNETVSNFKSTLNDFQNIWTGIALLAEPPYKSFKIKIKTLIQVKVLKLHYGVIFGLLSISLLTIKPEYDIYHNTFLISSIFGLGISNLLIFRNSRFSKAVTEKICKIKTKNTCNTVLESRFNQSIFGIGLSELCLVYFASILLFDYFSGETSKILYFYLNLITLPASIISLYIQYFKLKEYCILCLAIICSLAANFLLSINTYVGLPTINTVTRFSLIFSFVSLMTILFKKIASLSYKKKRLEIEHTLFKFNLNTFQTLLRAENKLPKYTEELIPIFSSLTNSPNTITLITNPFCSFCKKIHNELELMINTHKSIKIEVIFAVDIQDQESIKVSDSILGENFNGQWKALRKWFESNEKRTSNSTKINISPSEQLQKHINWCQQSKIDTTPTIYFNNHKLPMQYSVSDLSDLMHFVPN